MILTPSDIVTHPRGRFPMVPSAQRGRSAAQPSPGAVLARLVFFAILPALSLIACRQETVPQLPSPARLRLVTSASHPQAEVRHADIFIYDAETGILDSWQSWERGDGDIMTCSSASRDRIAVAIANLPEREYRLDEIRSLEDLPKLRCCLEEEDPEAPVMTGQLRVGDGYDEAGTMELAPLLCRIRLRSLQTDFSQRAYAGARLENVRIFLSGAGCETRLFPEETEQAYPSSYTDLPEASPDTDLFCYANPAPEDGPGAPMTRLVIQADLLGETWYYPIDIPQPKRNLSYLFDVTITMTGSRTPDEPVDAAAVRVGLTVQDWEEKAPEVVPFRQRVELRSANPEDEAQISDLNLFLFTRDGILQEHRWWSARNWEEGLDIAFDLLSPLEYTLAACANIGYKLEGIGSRDDLAAYRYYLVYPDEYSRGIPMTGRAAFTAGAAEAVSVPLQRLMAKVTLQVDRSRLDSDLRFDIRSVEVGNCAKSASLFGESRAETEQDIFAKGFYKEGTAVDPLNIRSGSGKSGTLELYVLENVQGQLLEGPVDPKMKVLPDGSPRKNVCSYIELHIDYVSDDWTSDIDHFLVYRFYLGEGTTDFSVRRNAHYHYTVTPEGDGLQGHPWRVDRSGLTVRKRFDLHPAAYNECSSSDSFHIWCDVSPSTTPMTIEPVAWDDDQRVTDLYDYEIDPDGYGITIHPHKGGSALVYFSAGAPVNRDTLALLVIDP